MIINTKNNPAQIINHLLYKKYSKFEFSYSRICINYLLNHEKCRIVAKFKDFLVFDDNTEFLHEFCDRSILFQRLKNIFNFYHSYSRIYPNYLIIPENKFLYKNIRKKQRLIDEENEIKYCTPKNKKISNYLNNDIMFFKKSIIESINKLNKSSNLNTIIKTNSIIKKSFELNKLNDIMCSTSSDDKKSRNLNKIRHSINQKMNCKGLLFKQNTLNNNINNISINTQSSSFIKNNYYEESTKSKASLTEIIDLINGKSININKNKKNGSSDKTNVNKIKKIKTNKNQQRFKFLMLDIDYIKKNIKTYKPKLFNYKNIKTDNVKTPSIKKKQINKKKNNNYKTNEQILIKNNNKDICLHKQTVSCFEDISDILKNKKKRYKRQQLSNYSKLHYNKINKKDSRINCFDIKTVTNMGSIYSKKNKINELKNNNNKYRRKSDSNTSKNLIFSSTISTNYSINFGNALNKVNTTNNNIRHNLDFKHYNETKQNYLRKKDKHKIMKSIETLINLGEKKRKLYNEKDINRVFKLKSDSHKSTKMTINKKTNHALSSIEKILTQIKKTINKNINKSKSKSKNKNNTNYNKKDYEFKNKISSYECKPFPEYFQKNIYFSKIQIKKQRTSTLIKNNKIFNFFTSKDFYNLKLNNNTIIRTSQNINNSKNKNNNNNIKRNIKSNNKNFEKSKLDLNYIDSNSFILRTFNNENNYQYQYENNNIAKNNNNQLFFNHFNFEKLKEKYNKYLYTFTSKDISNDKSDYYFFINKHKKTHTTNICKNIEEINKINKIKDKKDILKGHKRNKITILNYPINNSNIKLQLNYKAPSKNIIKSLKMKNNIITNSTNFEGNNYRDKLNINSHLLHLKN